MKFDLDKVSTLNPNSNSNTTDSSVNLNKFEEYVKNEKFAQFNQLNEIKKNYTDKELNENLIDSNIDEISLIKISSDLVLFKFANIIKDLVDCNKNIHEKIIMKGLNSFLVIENDFLVLYSVYRFRARNNDHILYQGNFFI
jgi:hypothetical protein